MQLRIILVFVCLLMLSSGVHAQQSHFQTVTIEQLELSIPTLYQIEHPSTNEIIIHIDPAAITTNDPTTLTIVTQPTDHILPITIAQPLNSNRDEPLDYKDQNFDGIPALWADSTGANDRVNRHMIVVWQGTAYEFTLTAPPLHFSALWDDVINNMKFLPEEDEPYFSLFSPDIPELPELPARISVHWSLENRPENSNLQFVQVLSNGEAVNVELPRDDIFVTSSGSGMIDVQAVGDDTHAKIQVRLVDMETDELLAVREILLPLHTIPENDTTLNAIPVTTPMVGNHPIHSPTTNIQNFTFGYGSDDGLLRLDTQVNFQWQIQSASRTQLVIYGNNGTIPIRTIELPTTTYNSLDYTMSELVPTSGSYTIELVVIDPVWGEERQSYDTDVHPAMGLPDYVEQAWVDAASVVTICLIRGENPSSPVTWSVTNNNPAFINSEPSVQVMYDWYVANIVGERLQTATRQTNSGTFTLDAMSEYTILVTTYLDINNGQYRYELGESGGIVSDQFVCQS